MNSPSLSYIMTLQGPPKKPVSLLGVFDPVTEHPWIFALGILGGAIFAGMHKRRR